MRGFARSVTKECARALERAGFVPRKLGYATLALEAGFQGWLGLNMETRHGDGLVVVNPFVGVRCEQVQRVIANVNGVKCHPYNPPTISTSLGTLIPDDWAGSETFVAPEPSAEMATRLAGRVAEYGIPYMRDHADLPALLEVLPSLVPREDAAERLAAAMVVAGDPDAAISELERRIDEEAEQGLEARRLRSFLQRLSDYLG